MRLLFIRWLALRCRLSRTGRQTDAGIGRYVVFDRFLTTIKHSQELVMQLRVKKHKTCGVRRRADVYSLVLSDESAFCDSDGRS